jgi:hypothetical protein
MKKRQYQYIQGKDPADPKHFKFITRDILCDDAFEGDLVMIAFPIDLMKEISSVLKQFGLRDDAAYFYSECKEVVSVPEKHVNEKGEGKLTFQSYFHKFPDSVQYFFDDAIIVVIMHPLETTDKNGLKDYNLIGYINVNLIDFKAPDGEVHNGYYYNILRLSEQTVNGKPIYRRKRIFTSMYSILLDLVTVNDVHFVYASMGRENQAINDALKMNSERNGKYFETFPMLNSNHINLFLGSGSAAKKLVDISNNKEALKEYFGKIKEVKEKLVFNQLYNQEKFDRMLHRIFSSSPGSKVYMLPDANGKMLAAGFFVYWGDYMYLKLQNPKGLFKVVESLKITDKLLYPILLTGDKKHVKQLLAGAAHKYRKELGAQITVMTANLSDPHYDLKKGILSDPFVHFVIYDRPELYEAMKQHSMDAKGNIGLFIDTPML